MTKKEIVDRLHAVCAELESVELRVNQVRQIGQIAACVKMIKKAAEGISDDDVGNEQGENVSGPVDIRADQKRAGADGDHGRTKPE